MNDLNLHLFCSQCNTKIPFIPQNKQIESLITTCPNCQTQDSYPILYIGKHWTNFYHKKLLDLLQTNDKIIISALGDHILILLNTLVRIKQSFNVDIGLYRTNDNILRCVCLVVKR